MKVRVLFLTLFLTMYFSVSAQDSYQESIAEYLTLNGTTQKYEGEYAKMFVLLKKHFSKSDISEATWTSLQTNKKQSIKEIQTKLAVSYKEHFSEKDIQKMTAFYKTDAGKQLATHPTKLSPEQNQAVAELHESGFGKKNEKKQQEVMKAVNRIASNWSRDLYLEKVNALKAKGFVPDYEITETNKTIGKGKNAQASLIKSQN
ncbi:DUF2059 domain-containing protein [Jejudonia soesokkakensis]|uniref:DUF2059 domain-containing protein n=1 Tax=Jejudonia soesokkakensis TaxID=1323432 RepID=A0ABW2MX50_9FLAO